MSLAEYSQETPATIASRMLEAVKAPELLGDAIEKHVTPYAARHHLPLHVVLLAYCESTLRSGCTAHPGGAATWEARMVAVAESTPDTATRAQITLEVMRTCTVPWSASVQSLIDHVLALPIAAAGSSLAALVSAVREQLKLLQMKRMLVSYGVREINLADRAQAMRLARTIAVHPTSKTALDDALLVAAAFDSLSPRAVYTLRLQYLAQKKRVAECHDMLKCDIKDAELRAKVAHEVTVWALDRMLYICQMRAGALVSLDGIAYAEGGKENVLTKELLAFAEAGGVIARHVDDEVIKSTWSMW